MWCSSRFALRVSASEWTAGCPSGTGFRTKVTKPFADEDVPQRIESNNEEKKDSEKEEPKGGWRQKDFLCSVKDVLRMAALSKLGVITLNYIDIM